MDAGVDFDEMTIPAKHGKLVHNALKCFKREKKLEEAANTVKDEDDDDDVVILERPPVPVPPQASSTLAQPALGIPPPASPLAQPVLVVPQTVVKSESVWNPNPLGRPTPALLPPSMRQPAHVLQAAPVAQTGNAEVLRPGAQTLHTTQ